MPSLQRPVKRELGDKIYYQVDPYDIISILLETLSYGIFLVLFLLSTILLLQRRRLFLREKVIEPVKLRSLMFYLVMSMLMFLVTTAKWAFWWAEVLPILHHLGPGIVAQLPRLSRTSYRFKEACIQLTVLLGDIITIYRLWILSNRNKTMIAFPVSGLFGFLASAIALSGPANDTSTTPIPIINGRLRLSDWDVAAISCTLAITVYVTSMIAWIFLRARLHAGARVFEQGLKQVLAVIVESAAIYTLWNIFFFIAGLGFHSEVALSFLDCMPTVYGISVMLINVRVGLGWARNDDRVPVHGDTLNGRRNFPCSPGQRGICISTVVFTEPCGPSQCEVPCAQSRNDIEIEDAGSVTSTATASIKPFSL